MDNKILNIQEIIVELDKLKEINFQSRIEERLHYIFSSSPDEIETAGSNYYSVVNSELYKFILKQYKYAESNVCAWRFFKKISPDQLEFNFEKDFDLKLCDYLMRTYFYSAPLDDLTCIFIPIPGTARIDSYLNWIKSNFYNVNYPTSLLWLYALDSSLASLFPDEIVYIGKSRDTDDQTVMLPDYSYNEAVLIKRFSGDKHDFITMSGNDANREFKQIFSFLEKEYRDRCLSHSVKESDRGTESEYNNEWEKFKDVLGFGVSDKAEAGTISFSDLRSSTDFLNTFGKNFFRNKIQQPFFEKTKLITNLYDGRIDKFMGDNVMCVFLNNPKKEKEQNSVIINNFFAIFKLCKVLLDILSEQGLTETKLGLRSGVSYGENILRSNLGNEIVRDFTVTGEAVNLAARLEHFSIQELILHNRNYFEKAIERFPQISEILSLQKNENNINPETRSIIKNYTLYQNLISNLETLANIRFDVRMNNSFYNLLKDHLGRKGYNLQNNESRDIYGYEEFLVEGHSLKFYFSFYNPKGFNKYEKIWILPLPEKLLLEFDIDKLGR